MSKRQRILADPKFYEVLLERLGQAAALVLDADGKIVYLSKRASRLLNVSSGRALNKSFFRVVPLSNEAGTDLPERKNPVWQALHTKNYKQVTPFFCRLNRKRVAPVVVRALQVKQGKATVGAVVEMRQVKRELNVGEMKSLFVSFAAHQLKTPSSIVKGFLELMMRQGETSYQKEQWYNLQSAFEANETLIHLSKTLLNLTRLEGGMVEPKIIPFNPIAVLQQKIDSHRLLLEVKEINIDFQKPSRAPVFSSDELFFSEIFEILFNNALKHSPPKTQIAVRCKITPSVLEVEVEDQGPGISAEAQKTIFAGTAETNNEQNGHGLGLLMAKKYLALLGGTLGLRPAKLTGARFYFSIPKPLL